MDLKFYNANSSYNYSSELRTRFIYAYISKSKFTRVLNTRCNQYSFENRPFDQQSQVIYITEHGLYSIISAYL